MRIGLVAVLLWVSCGLLGAQSFKNPVRIATGRDPDTVYVGDLNGDGVPDLLYGTTTYNGTVPTATLHPLLADGKGGYTAGVDLPLPVTVSTKCRLGDLNGDGELDLVCGGAGESSLFSVLLGNGDGTFQAGLPNTLPPPGGGFGVYPAVVADLNHDGHADVVMIVGGESLSYYVYLGDGTGRLALSATVPTVGSAGDVQVADLNGDGNPDLVATGTYGMDTEIALGHGDGSFADPVRYPGNAGTVLADVDGDGHPDLIGGGLGVLKIFHGNADGTFGATPIATMDFTDGKTDSSGLGVYQSPLASLDLNGDGIPDILAVGKDGLVVLLGRPGLQFAAPVPYVVGDTSYTGFGATSLAVADLDGDGHVDLVSRGPNGLYLSAGRADGTFASADTFLAGNFLSMVTVADFNEDGDPDVVTSGDTTLMFSPGRGAGSFAPASPIPSLVAAVDSVGYREVAHGDVNGDGHQDLVALYSTANASDGLFLLPGHGDGSFGAPTLIGPVASYDTLQAVVDVNNDGRADPVTVSFIGADTAVNVALAKADGTFQKVSTPLPAINGEYVSQTVVLGDLDGDGLPDLVYTTTAHLAVMHGKGDGSFGAPVFFALPAISGSVFQFPGRPAIGDFDGDGLPDVAVLVEFKRYSGDLGPTQILTFYRQGSATTLDANSFTTAVPGPVTQREFYELDAVDLDGDGRTDLVATGAEYLPAPSAISVFPGAADRSFGPELDYVAGAGLGPLSFADLNHDGRPDIVTGNDVANAFTVLLSQGPALVTGTLVASPNPVATGSPFTLKATLIVPAGTDTLTGTVDFSVDDIPLGTATLVNNVATLAGPTTLAVGTHRLGAVSSVLSAGASSFPAVRLHGAETVNPLPVVLTLTATPNPLTVGQTAVLAVAVQNGPATPAGVTQPTGAVTLQVAGTIVGTVPAQAQPVSLSYTFGTPGSFAVTATYPGDTTHAGGTAQMTVVVNAMPGFTLALLPPRVQLPLGGQVVSAVTLGSQGGYTGTLALAVGTLPAGLTVSLAAQTVNLSAGDQKAINLVVSATNDQASTAPGHAWRSAGMLSLACLLPLGWRKRRLRGAVLTCAGALLMLGIQGCGQIGEPLIVLAPGTYQVPITATDTASGVAHSAELTIVITGTQPTRLATSR